MRIRARVMVPYNFGIESRIPIIFTVFGERIIIVSQAFEGVRVLSYLSQDFASLNGPKKGRVFWKMNQKFKIGEEKFTRKVVVNEASENFLEGTIDLLKSTGFYIYFEFPDKLFTKNEKTNEIIKEKVTEILDYFINTYRSLTNEVDVHNPSMLEFPVMELHYSRINFTSDEEIIDGEYKFLARLLCIIKSEHTGYFKKMIGPEILQKIHNSLNSNEPVPLHLQLLADAREHAIIRKDYKTSIILTASATEVYLKTKFIRECNFRKITSLTVEL